MKTEIKVYAPVVIPTLCRYDTFVRCVESLARCTGANQTELFIGLDYPAKESHREGWEKISHYVDTIKGFKAVHIYKRETNYGQGRNTREILDIIKKRFDRYILSEDDNEFSPNFLEYIDKGLDKFKDDPDVIAICGYNYPFDYMNDIRGYAGNAYPMKFFSAWGCGRWFSKLSSSINKDMAYEVIHSWKRVLSLWKAGHFITVHRLLYRHERAYGDLMWRVRCVTENKYSIFPRKSKVRNWGFNSAQSTNCASIDIYERQSIDEELTFEYDDFEIENDPAVRKAQWRLSGGRLLFRIICVLEYIMFRMTGKAMRDITIIKNIMKLRVRKIGVDN